MEEKQETVKVKKRRIDKRQLAIKLVASILALIFIGTIVASAIFYLIG